MNINETWPHNRKVMQETLFAAFAKQDRMLPKAMIYKTS
jgi:hypothetical protein